MARNSFVQQFPLILLHPPHPAAEGDPAYPVIVFLITR